MSIVDLQIKKVDSIRLYIYLDDLFQAKTEIIYLEEGINVDFELELQDDSKEIRIDKYDVSGLTEEQIDQIY